MIYSDTIVTNCILIADDDADDRKLIQKAFKECNMENDLCFVEDGQEVMDFLHNTEKRSSKSKSLPDMILLDLNMPRKDGREALKEIKSDPVLKRVPVIVFTTSKSSDDILSTYESGGNCFITKPASFKELLGVVKQINDFWFKTAQLPIGL